MMGLRYILKTALIGLTLAALSIGCSSQVQKEEEPVPKKKPVQLSTLSKDYRVVKRNSGIIRYYYTGVQTDNYFCHIKQIPGYSLETLQKDVDTIRQIQEFKKGGEDYLTNGLEAKLKKKYNLARIEKIINAENDIAIFIQEQSPDKVYCERIPYGADLSMEESLNRGGTILSLYKVLLGNISTKEVVEKYSYLIGLPILFTASDSGIKMIGVDMPNQAQITGEPAQTKDSIPGIDEKRQEYAVGKAMAYDPKQTIVYFLWSADDSLIDDVDKLNQNNPDKLYNSAEFIPNALLKQ